jgi:hypothetical protein
MYVDPEFAAGFVPFEQTLSARVVDAQENDVDAAGLNAMIAWSLPGLPAQKANTATFVLSQQGTFFPRAYFGDRSPVLNQDVELYGLPSMLGAWSATATGTASGCEDEEDNGPGSESADISISTQAIQGTSELAFRIGGSGGAGGLTVNTINISVSSVSVSETSITGEASGSADYTIVEDGFDDEGNPVTYTTTGTAQFSGRLENNQFNLSGIATDDSGGCTGNGTLTLQRIGGAP